MPNMPTTDQLFPLAKKAKITLPKRKTCVSGERKPGKKRTPILLFQRKHEIIVWCYKIPVIL